MTDLRARARVCGREGAHAEYTAQQGSPDKTKGVLGLLPQAYMLGREENMGTQEAELPRHNPG